MPISNSRRRAIAPINFRDLSRHLRVLREAGLVEVRQEAQRRVYSLRPEPLAEVDEWLGRHRALREKRLDALHPEVVRGTRTKERQMTSNARAGTRILGSLRSADGKGVVRVEDRLDTDIDDMWLVLTDPLRLARWIGEVEGDLRLGGEYRARLFCQRMGRHWARLPMRTWRPRSATRDASAAPGSRTARAMYLDRYVPDRLP